MKVPVNIAEKLLQLCQGESIPSSSAKHSLIDNLVSEGIIERRGRIKKSLTISNKIALVTYLQNHLGINNLEQYIQVATKENVSRSELTSASADSKLKYVRTFKGFLINCYAPITAELNGKQIIINPAEGTFQFIYDFENFIVSSDITVVGIENPENFRHVNKQQYLFDGIKPLFISRYPQNQSKDLIKWLQSIPNNYMHFGDFDFAGIGIYLNEFKKYLNERAIFFIPYNIEEQIRLNGNRKLYDNQKVNFKTEMLSEENLFKLIETIHKYRKGLEQEVLIMNSSF